MRTDSLRQYVELREALAREKAQIEERLAMINNALGGGASSPGAATGLRLKAAGKRIRNKISLREAVRQVTTKKALTKEEILAAVGELGYKFTSSTPVNSLNAILYSNKQFKNLNGRFRPAK